MSDQDWRETAYLIRKNWPEAIPDCGPKRKSGPYPWGEKSHDDPHGVDSYPMSHPDAASVGGLFAGDVCPYCGVPLRYTERVVTIDGDRGHLNEVSPDKQPVPSYHPECWRDRGAEIHGTANATLSGGGSRW